MSMEKLANHIITVAHDNNLTITNLQLQKILYFTLRNSVNILDRKTIEETYDEPFLVWRYGPVVESQYNRFYSYGSSPIIDSFEQIPEYEDLNNMIIHFLSIDVFRMVDASHTHKFWKENSPKIEFGRSNIKYPLEEVLREH
ncbi:Protein of unknown function [Streptococcus equinus]|uniref:Panacea domain-containing protein n=1 Tax=Streptococcus equinus TaxID=1335 RepID=UPI0008BB0D59|nr:type II toxin-antitoxin system antitoxin SocA domain-containing protein [Streptococcus equinus]SEK49248.1 Protein of unknown function [Streptococcus equinus]